MADTSTPRTLTSARVSISKGLLTVAISLVVLVVVSVILAPSSVSQGAVLGMLPFAAVLAIVGLGQMLVVQQGGIDLSVPGGVSLAVVLDTSGSAARASVSEPSSAPSTPTRKSRTVPGAPAFGSCSISATFSPSG